MICPKCGEYLEAVVKNGVLIDYCNTCRGVWFDLSELETMSDKIEQFNFVEPRLEYLKIAETYEEQRPCPRCAEKMMKVKMRDKPPVIDCCPNNHGYWFDEAELKEYIKNNMVALDPNAVSVLENL